MLVYELTQRMIKAVAGQSLEHLKQHASFVHDRDMAPAVSLLLSLKIPCI